MLPEYPDDFAELCRMRVFDPCHDLDSYHTAWIRQAIHPAKNANVEMIARWGARDEKRRIIKRTPDYLRQRVLLKDSIRPEENIERAEARKIVQTELLRFSPRDQQIVKYFFFDQMPPKEIAEELKISLMKTYRLINRIKQKMKSNQRLANCI